MLSSPQTVTYDSASVNLNRINNDNYTSDYFGKAVDGTGITLQVKHTIPVKGGDGESHLIRLDIDHLDSSGVFAKTVSAWLVMKTAGLPQDDSDVQLAVDALLALVPTIDSSVIGRES